MGIVGEDGRDLGLRRQSDLRRRNCGGRGATDQNPQAGRWRPSAGLNLDVDRDIRRRSLAAHAFGGVAAGKRALS